MSMKEIKELCEVKRELVRVIQPQKAREEKVSSSEVKWYRDEEGSGLG